MLLVESPPHGVELQHILVGDSLPLVVIRGLALAILFSLAGCCLNVISGGTSGREMSGTSTAGGGTSSGRVPTTNGTSTGSFPIAVGPCTADSQCVSGICGANGSGSGNCCKAACADTTPPCGATDCDAQTGGCVLPGSETACSQQVCVGETLIGPACDGAGHCAIQTVPCQGNTFCDPASAACCPVPEGQLAVDSVTGNDGPCCGLGRGPCRTLTRAMDLINGSEVPGTAIVATVDGGGGDWGTAETYPVALGWDVTLLAAGVYFNDEGANPELFDIASIPSAGKAQALATIMGSSEEHVFIGVSQSGAHSTDPSTIQVEPDNALYLLDATIGSSMSSKTAALTVIGKGKLFLGQNQYPSPNTVFGDLTIGTDSAGWNGIVCTPMVGGGCGVFNSEGAPPIVIVGQQNQDIDAEDGAAIGLNNVKIGLDPAALGFGQCPDKPDTGASNGPAVLLHGTAGVSLYAAVVQCIQGTGFELVSSPNGTPTLNLSGSVIQNTRVGIYAVDGVAEIHGSGIRFNAIGVWQDDNGHIDLSGTDFPGEECDGDGLAGGNIVACNFGTEIGESGAGVSVLNTSSNFLNACNCDWDTPWPDVFLCDASYTTCTCEARRCTEDGRATENMDAVYTSTNAPVITAANSISSLDCGMP